jgi:hypothetical protein
MMESSRMRIEGHVTGIGKMRNTHNILVQESDRNTALERPRPRCVDNVTVYAT